MRSDHLYLMSCYLIEEEGQKRTLGQFSFLQAQLLINSTKKEKPTKAFETLEFLFSIQTFIILFSTQFSDLKQAHWLHLHT